MSTSLRDDTYRHFNITREVEVIPNFIKLEHYKAKAEKNFRQAYAPNGERIITHISNFRPVKRVEDVVQIFKQIRESIPCKLLMVGDGPERYKVEHLCRELGICADTHILGKLKKPEEVLWISDLFVLPSETESFGLAALEAMACGVPVICTNTGGLAELNTSGFSGFTSNVGDIDNMAANALSILSTDEALQTYRQQAKTRAADFSIERILPIYVALYERVITLAHAIC